MVTALPMIRRFMNEEAAPPLAKRRTLWEARRSIVWVSVAPSIEDGKKPKAPVSPR